MTARSKTKPAILPYSPENYPDRFPTFETEGELRDFFDTHDMSYYWDQGEDVTNNPPPGLRQGRGRHAAPDPRWPIKPKVSLNLTFPTEMMAALSAFATERDIPVEVLLQWWIADRLEQEQQAAGHQESSPPDTRQTA